MKRKIRIISVAAALMLMVLPVSCGMSDGNKVSNGMNENGIYDGSNGRNALNGAGDVIDDAGNAIERGADRIQRGLDNLDDGMTNNSTTSTTMSAMTTTTTTRTPASMR
ncbi:MAG: hypothetical protein IIZ08_06120 [Clostridia bacterium]|nr:hypothetical protein [Clostridia bacterium]